MKNLYQSKTKIDFIGCVNSAINLTTENSEALKILKKFEKRGTKISTCGTCLDFYNKKNYLLIGDVGNMKDAVNLITKADRVITIN